ncbi:MAG: GTP pyrophosphokinase family protein, partial [Firmicutes bacterium]|nr:GTP pyrophosphokinase family protein [Bacillota bacterium]
IAMDFWASLEHKIHYKFDGETPVGFKRELKECADIASFLDRKMEALRDEVNYYRPQSGQDVYDMQDVGIPVEIRDAMFGELAE